jgi:hypothetical protein
VSLTGPLPFHALSIGEKDGLIRYQTTLFNTKGVGTFEKV